MILRRVRFRNFGSYGNDIQTIEFSDGINLISGENGSGKSTLLEPIFFGLYGKPFKKGNLSDIVNWTNEGGEEVWIDVENGGRSIEIYRTMNEQRLVLDGVEQTEFATNKTAFQREIDRLVGINHSLFRKLVIISADSVKAMPSMTAGEKREMVDEYFSLKILVFMLSIAKNKKSIISVDKDISERAIAEKESDIRTIGQHIELTEESITAQRLGIDKEIESLNDELAGDVLRINDDIKSCEGEIATLNEKISLLDERSKQFESDKKEKIDKITSRLSVLREGKTKSIESIELENSEIDKKIASKKQELENTRTQAKKDREERVVVLTSEIDTIKETIMIHEQIIEGIEKERGEKESIIDSFDSVSIDKEVNKCTSRLSEISLLAKQGADKKKFLDENDICPTCDNPLTEEHKKLEISNLTKERKALIAEKEEITAVLEDLHKKIHDHNTLVAEFKGVEDTLTRIKSDINSLEYKLKEKSNDIKNLEDSSKFVSREETYIMDDISDLEKSKKDPKMVSLEYDEKIAKGESLLSSEISVIDTSKDDKKIIASKIDDIKKSIIRYQTTIEETKSRALKRSNDLEEKKACSELTGQIAKLKDKLKTHETALNSEKVKFSKLEKDLEIMENVILALSDKGVKTHFIKQFVPSLNKTIANLIKMFSLPISLTFDDKLNISVNNLGSRKKAKYFQHSKGERKRIDFVILLAFIDNVMKIMNWKTNFIIFDEFLDGGMDTKGMDDIIEMLHTFANNYSVGVYIITHKVSNDYFKERWMISKVDGFSTIEVKR